MPKFKNTQLIKEEAHRLGFSFVGFSKADFLEEEAPSFREMAKRETTWRDVLYGE